MKGKPLTKSEKREKKRFKKRYGMKIDGRSIFVIQDVIQNKAKKLRCYICGRGIPPAELGGGGGGSDLSKPICTMCELKRYT